MKRLREILRDHYIGAVAIGFLLFQTVGGIINAVMQPILVYIQTRNAPQSVLASQSIFRWPQIIALLIDAVMHLIVAALLMLWLYRKPKVSPAPPPEQPSAKS